MKIISKITGTLLWYWPCHCSQVELQFRLHNSAVEIFTGFSNRVELDAAPNKRHAYFCGHGSKLCSVVCYESRHLYVHVSAVSLVSKCSASAFRMHIRADDTFLKMLGALHDAPQHPVCYCTSRLVS